MGATFIHVMLHISILPNRYDCAKHVRLALCALELLSMMHVLICWRHQCVYVMLQSSLSPGAV